MAYIDPAAAPKYGPTPYYGRCEVRECTAKARATCPRCGWPALLEPCRS